MTGVRGHAAQYFRRMSVQFSLPHVAGNVLEHKDFGLYLVGVVSREEYLHRTR